MRHLKIMLAWLCALLMTASCSNEMEPENTTGSDVAQLIKIGNFPAFEEGTQTRALGAADPGKTAWAEGDKVLLKIQLNDGTAQAATPQCFTLTYSASTPGWTANKPLTLNSPDYRATADITAYYAPAYEWDDASPGNLKLMSGKTAGTDEYLVHKATVTSLKEGISIDFSNVRTYSRLRVVTTANQQITLTSAAFTPAAFTPNGETTPATNEFTATADDKGNAYFYGSWTEKAAMKISVNGVTVNKTIAASTPNKSYAWMPCMQFTVKVEANNLKFSIPFPADGTTPPAAIIVNWGDGNSVTVGTETTLSATDDFNHTYSKADTYQITLAFADDKANQKMPEFNFYNYRTADGSNATKLISMDTPLLQSANDNFNRCFAECSNLAKIPAGLFDNNTEATNFSGCFQNCGITQIPAKLFDNNTAATNFYCCFINCKKLKLNKNIFINETHTSETRFATVSGVNFMYCFGDCGTELLEGEDGGIAPALWDKNVYTFNPDPTSAGCFFGCGKVTNFNAIPAAWKELPKKT